MLARAATRRWQFSLRAFLLVAVTLSVAVAYYVNSLKQERRSRAEETRWQSADFLSASQIRQLHSELTSGLDQSDAKAASAIFELQQFYSSPGQFRFRRVSSQTIDKRKSEVILLVHIAALSPGFGHAMAFLVVEDAVCDWKSCWSATRAGFEIVTLEDVDGDGYLDVGFRFASTRSGCGDKREREIPGHNGKWLGAYKIHSSGFRPLMPENDRRLDVEYQVEQPSSGLIVALDSTPLMVHERMLYEVTVSISNKTEREIPISEWGLTIEPTHDGVSIAGSLFPGCNVPGIHVGETRPLKAILRVTSEAEDGVSLLIRFGRWKW